jgi:glycosyltransferase involved in cell wall biosynthesis
MKVLGLALYGPLAASTRYRLCQYVPGLTSMGVDLQIRHLLGDDYLSARFSGGVLPITTMLKDGWARLEDLWHQNDYDAIMLHCELFPLMPGWFDRALLRKPYIYDFDDAFYLKYSSGRMRLARPLLGTKFDNVIAGAAAVTAGNHVLASYARIHNTNTRYLPTVIDTTRYVPEPAKRCGQVFTIGWIGSPSTAPYLSELAAPLSAIGLEGPVRLIVIGGKAPNVHNVTIVEHDWSENTEIDIVNTFDVGVMPLPDDDWARGKCAFKLIQYMACAVPVIASPVGANVEVVNGKCGLMASTHQEWLDALRLLRDQPNLRYDMGQSGRERVVEYYSLHQNLSPLASVMFQAAGKSSSDSI